MKRLGHGDVGSVHLVSLRGVAENAAGVTDTGSVEAESAELGRPTARFGVVGVAAAVRHEGFGEAGGCAPNKLHR